MNWKNQLKKDSMPDMVKSIVSEDVQLKVQDAIDEEMTSLDCASYTLGCKMGYSIKKSQDKLVLVENPSWALKEDETKVSNTRMGPECCFEDDVELPNDNSIDTLDGHIPYHMDSRSIVTNITDDNIASMKDEITLLKEQVASLQSLNDSNFINHLHETTSLREELDNNKVDIQVLMSEMANLRMFINF